MTDVSINDLYLLKKSLNDFILLLCDLDCAYAIPDVVEVLQTLKEIILQKEETLL